MSTPSSALARSRPSFASWLNDRSSRPPMSVTMPTLMAGFSSCWAAEPSSSSPQPAKTNAPITSARAAIKAAMRRGSTADPPHGGGVAEGGGSLVGRPTLRPWYLVQEGAFQRIGREGRLHGGPRDVQQLLLLKAEALARNGLRRADTTAEVGRIIGAERDAHPGGPERTERMVLVARVEAERDVRRWTDLEHDAALGERADQGGVLDRAHPVRHARD